MTVGKQMISFEFSSSNTEIAKKPWDCETDVDSSFENDAIALENQLGADVEPGCM